MKKETIKMTLFLFLLVFIHNPAYKVKRFPPLNEKNLP